MNIQLCIKIKKIILSKISAITPAGIAKKKTGSVMAVWTNATFKGDVDNKVINQLIDVICIHEPILERVLALQRILNLRLRKSANEVILILFFYN